MTWEEFANAYCETQLQTPEGLRDALQTVNHRFKPDGFLIAECKMMDSSQAGQRIILPYGGNATLKEPPSGPFSPRGVASDMSVVIGTVRVEDIP